ncbi:MAG: hypothetical protein LAT51_01325 [Flavobacteriaceae bacterium]|nr:hypothetical protein [Flavobacteriaceae bacterium]
MKNIIFNITILTILLISLVSNAQTIIVWGEDNGNLPNDFKSTGQYYYKDVHNYLDNFEGTWEYEVGNKKFQIILTKVEFYHEIDNVLNLNFYHDGITIQYRKYEDDSLVFESPSYETPNFSTTDGVLLKGAVSDYGRITKTVYYPVTNQVRAQGGEPIYPRCHIELVDTQPNETAKISFKLYLIDVINYDKETYAGQDLYSIPNDVILEKVE